MNREKLNNLGYSNYFESIRISSGYDDMLPVRVMAEHKGSYMLSDGENEFSGKVTGKMMQAASSREDYPAVGDWVLITPMDNDNVVINSILPRRTVLQRKLAGRDSGSQIIAANIDIVFIMQSPDRDYNLNRFERYLAIAEAGGIKPVLILNKADLLSEEELESRLSELKERFIDAEIHATSVSAGTGMEDLRNSIKSGMTYCFIGSSGVGKSSIINMLIGNDMIKTGEISAYSDRGTHVTTHRQLYILKNGGLLIDNPGMREIGILDSDKGIDTVFADIHELGQSCRFADCTHVHEPGCAVIEAVESGELDEGRYKNYLRLYKENIFNTMNKAQRKQKDKQFGKFLKNYKKEYRK